MLDGIQVLNTIPAQPAQYEVVVSDGVDFKEFYERYEIIEQKGKIYVITERKTDEQVD